MQLPTGSIEQRFLSDKKPMCYVCQRPVEKLEVDYRPSDKTYIFYAYCHGEEEQLEIKKHSAIGNSLGIVDAGYAFMPKNEPIELPQPQLKIEDK